MSTNKPGMVGKRRKSRLLQRGVQPETIDKVAAQMVAAESADAKEYEIRQVPLANILLWEAQPRTFCLTLEDVYRGLVDPKDEFAATKADELEGIIGLAMSLKESGMLNAPLGYALPGKIVQLFGGQRRTMASIFALFHLRTSVDTGGIAHNDVKISPDPDLSLLEIERIAIKVFSRKPDVLTIERMGMADNVQRADLPIPDKLRWAIKFADMNEGRGREVGWRDLIDTLALSRSQAYEWLKVINARRDEWVNKVIGMVLLGEAPLKKLTEIAAADVGLRESMCRRWFEESPTSDTKHRVSLGVSNNLPALRNLVLSNVANAERERFEQIDWNKPKEVKKAFAEFLNYWEGTHG